MRKLFGALVAAALLAVYSAHASAGSITYDFTGVGQVCDVSTGACASNLPFDGWFSIDIEPAGDTYAFQINWPGGSMSPHGYGGELPSSAAADVLYSDADTAYLAQVDGVHYEITPEGDTITYLNYVTLFLIYPPGSDPAFPEPAMLVLGLPIFTQISFGDIIGIVPHDSETSINTGIVGNVILSALVPRATAVAEPSAFGLSGIGTFAAFFMRRRHRRANRAV